MTQQPHKQRAETREAPLHERHKQVRARLADDLREEHDQRTVRVNQGDTVEVMRGDFAGDEGEVINVDLRDATIHVEDVTNETVDGEEVPRPLETSNVRVTNLDLSDPERQARLESGGDE
jgi:large subunit ribosomal protein L24